jgi:eukaryotic-like serine/threonine-protein kinase
MKTCPNCGVPLTGDDSRGACLRCLLQEGLLVRLHTMPIALDEGSSLICTPGARYEILGEIGQGGMGAVYRARRLEDGRLMAVKVLRASLRYCPDFLGRFLREAQIASALDHVGICRIYEVGQAPGWGFFIVMELVTGQTLAVRLREGPLDPDGVIGIAIQVGAALHAAHALGVIHRDIKSSNLSLSADGQVKLLDFGLAKWFAPNPSAPRPAFEFQTQGGKVLGSPGYMSPEQVLGGVVDSRTDLFSLGVVLYEAITGQLPFRGVTSREMVRQLLHAEPAPLGRFKGNVPAGLEEIVHRCLRKDPAARYGSAEEFQLAVQSLLQTRKDARVQGDAGGRCAES